jgi:hypothetical protein
MNVVMDKHQVIYYYLKEMNLLGLNKNKIITSISLSSGRVREGATPPEIDFCSLEKSFSPSRKKKI